MAGVSRDDAAKLIGDCARRLVHSELLWKNNHGNISVRLEGVDEFMLTGSVLEPFDPESLSRIGIDGEVIDGYIAPMAREITQLHAVIYRHRSTASAVVHAHSPHATGYAVAGEDMPIFTMALARLVGGTIRVSKFGPRGSEQEVDSIADLIDQDPDAKAVLLRNHGVLAWGDTMDEATRIIFAIEENAEASMWANSVGAAQPIPDEFVTAAQQRRAEFEKLGPIAR